MNNFPTMFANVRDPRRTSHVSHPLLTIIGIVLLAMLCGAEGWDDMYLWALARQRWLSTILDLSGGVPSADSIRRVFAALDPKSFREGFEAWAQALVRQCDDLQLAVDGKTIRGSAQRGLKAVHVVRAFVVQNHLVLGQLATDEKSNEITAIPELLKTIAVKNRLVSIDAMGAQRAITEQIVSNGGDYLVGVKDNQPTLRAEIEATLGKKTVPTRTSSTFAVEEGEAHGRKERRRVWTQTRLAGLDACLTWPRATTIIRVESTRISENTTSVENRYYISSRRLTARMAGNAIRGHWAIENTCHWSLDVTLGEDNSRIAEGNAAENLSLVRSVVLAAMKRSPERTPGFGKLKLSMRQKRKLCGWDNDVLLTMLRSLILAKRDALPLGEDVGRIDRAAWVDLGACVHGRDVRERHRGDVDSSRWVTRRARDRPTAG